MLGTHCYGASGERQETRIVTNKNKNKKENHKHKTKEAWKPYRRLSETLRGLEEQRKPDILGTGTATGQMTNVMK